MRKRLVSNNQSTRLKDALRLGHSLCDIGMMKDVQEQNCIEECSCIAECFRRHNVEMHMQTWMVPSTGLCNFDEVRRQIGGINLCPKGSEPESVLSSAATWYKYTFVRPVVG